MMLFPFALVLMYGRMLKRHAARRGDLRRSCWPDDGGHDRLGRSTSTRSSRTPALTAHPAAQTYEIPSASAPGGKLDVTLPAVAGLPVDQHLGNLEGKELRFGTSAGATFAALTTDVTCGAVNAETDSLNPLAGLSPMVGMWLNCIFGGKGVGMINMLMFLIIGIFVAGMMVGRTPEYLGKKIGAREVKLAMIALLVHPLMILVPDRPVRRHGLGNEGGEQSRAARLFADRLPVLLGLGQQRLGLRRPGRDLRLRQQRRARRPRRCPGTSPPAW